MSLSNYDALVIDPFTGGTIAYLTAEQLKELRFSVKINGIGACALTFETNVDYYWGLLNRPDLLIDVRRSGIVEGTYLLSTRQLGAEGNQEYLVIGGMSLEQLIARRVIDPADDSNLPNGGYVTKAGPADVILRALMREQLGDLASFARQLPGVTVPAVLGTGDSRGFRKRYEELSATMLDILTSSNIDVAVVRTDRQNIEIRFAPRGTDKSYETNFPNAFTAFSPERGNLSNPSYIEDWSESSTYVYVAGKGEGANRVVAQQGNPGGINESPYGRRESYVDARDAETVTDLLTKAASELNLRAKETKFDFDVVSERGGSTYRVDFFLGDVVSVYWKNVRDRVRINELEFNISEEGENISIGVTNIL